MRRIERGGQTAAPVGVHHVLELYGCPAVVLNDAALLSGIMRDTAALSNTRLLNLLVHPFPSQGVTALALLAESHIALHTWPEHGYAAVDLFACGTRARPEAGSAYLIEALHARRHTLRILARGDARDARRPEMAPGDDPPHISRDAFREGALQS